MTKAVFYERDGLLIGFDISGHTANYDSEQARLVCAAVSSAVYMTANTITDVICADVDITEKDGRLSLKLLNKIPQCSFALSGLKLHIEELSKQYTDFINTITEVQHDA